MINLGNITSRTREGVVPGTQEVTTTLQVVVTTVMDTDRASQSKIDIPNEILKNHAEMIWHIVYGDIADELHQIRFHHLNEPPSHEYYWFQDHISKLLVRLDHPQPQPK